MSQALQAPLSGQYAAIYAYGRAGGRLSTDEDVALTLLADHRTDRDQLRAWLLSDGEQPDPPAPAYTLPGTVRSDAAARRLLATVELRLIPVLVQLLAEESDEARRRWAVRAVRRSALTAQDWGAAPQAFPWPADLTPPA